MERTPVTVTEKHNGECGVLFSKLDITDIEKTKDLVKSKTFYILDNELEQVKDMKLSTMQTCIKNILTINDEIEGEI